MTSALSIDDIEDALVRAGIRDPIARRKIRQMVEAYARKFPVAPILDDIPPVNIGDMQGYKYRCRKCRQRKFIGEFPEYKRLNRRSPIACTDCLSNPRKIL